MSSGHTEIATQVEEQDPAIFGETALSSVNQSALEVMARAEIDSQIATAKRYPRSLAAFKRDAESMLSFDSELAEKCTFVLPGRNEQGKKISGPSVRLSEFLVPCWGNIHIDSRIVGTDALFVTAQAVATDLEKNIRYSQEVQRGITYSGKGPKAGQRFGNDLIRVTGMAAQSIARRNVTFLCIPKALVSYMENYAKSIARGDIKTLPARTEAALAWFAKKGVDAAKIFAVLDIKGVDDMTLDLIVELNGLKTAIVEGHATIEEMFPMASVSVSMAANASLADRIAQNTGTAPEPAQAAPEAAEKPPEEKVKKGKKAEPTSQPAQDGLWPEGRE